MFSSWGLLYVSHRRRAITVNPRRPLSHEGAELRSEPSLSLEQGLDLLERSMSFDENGYPSSECPLFALLSTWPPVEPPGLVLLGQLLSDPSLAKKIPMCALFHAHSLVYKASSFLVDSFTALFVQGGRPSA